MTILHITTTRARAILFTILLIGVVVTAPGQAAAKLGRGAEISVGTTAVQLRDTSVAQTAKRQVLACVPEAAAGPVYVGGLGVTTATGMPVDPGRCYSATLDPGEALYGIVQSGTVSVRVQERSL